MCIFIFINFAEFFHIQFWPKNHNVMDLNFGKIHSRSKITIKTFEISITHDRTIAFGSHALN